MDGGCCCCWRSVSPTVDACHSPSRTVCAPSSCYLCRAGCLLECGCSTSPTRPVAHQVTSWRSDRHTADTQHSTQPRQLPVASGSTKPSSKHQSNSRGSLRDTEKASSHDDFCEQCNTQFMKPAQKFCDECGAATALGTKTTHGTQHQLLSAMAEQQTVRR